MNTKLPPPEQWALCKMNEMEVAEMIEQHIDFFAVNENGNERSVHLPMQFVRHFIRRSDGALPTTAAYATMPLVLGDGTLLVPEGLDRKRGIQFLIQDEVRAIIPKPEDCTEAAVKAAMTFLTDEWLVDVPTTYAGKAVLIALALTLIERSLLPERPCFFITAGRRGTGKTTAIKMLIKAVIGFAPAASAWSSNEEERRKSLMSHFLYGKPYILWDNIPRGLQLSCPHIERSCTSAHYSDRRLGVSEIAQAAASTIHVFTGNNVGAKGDLASRSLFAILSVERADPENRKVEHSDALGWTDSNRGKILQSLYTILLGNPQLRCAQGTATKTRFPMWWWLVGSAIEHAAKLSKPTEPAAPEEPASPDEAKPVMPAWQEVDFVQLFLAQEDDDEESASLADVLEILLRRLPEKFEAKDAAALVNTSVWNRDEDSRTLREFLLPGVLDGHVFSAVSVGNRLKKHRNEPVFSGTRTLTLHSQRDTHTEVLVYTVTEQVTQPAPAPTPVTE